MSVLTFSEREMDTREEQRREMPSRLSGCQETGAGVWAPDMAKSR